MILLCGGFFFFLTLMKNGFFKTVKQINYKSEQHEL